MVDAIKSRRSDGHTFKNRQSFGHSGSGHSFKKRHSPEDDSSLSPASTPGNSKKSSMNASPASTPNNSPKNMRSVIALVEALKGHKNRTDPNISPRCFRLPLEAPPPATPTSSCNATLKSETERPSMASSKLWTRRCGLTSFPLAVATLPDKTPSQREITSPLPNRASRLPAEAPSQGETTSPLPNPVQAPREREGGSVGFQSRLVDAVLASLDRDGSSTISFDELEKALHRALAAEQQAAQAAISTITRPPPARAHSSSSCEIASSLPVSSGQSATTERVRSATQDEIDELV